MAVLSVPILILFAYLMIFVVIGYWEYRKGNIDDPEEYYLAGRGLGIIVLGMTLFATLESAWAYFGGQGFAYAAGVGVITLAVANVFGSLNFFLIGIRSWDWAKRFGYISPAEMFRERLESDAVGLVVLVFMVLFVIPYIALQPMAGGLIFEMLSDGAISRNVGVLIMLIVMTGYVLVAGMRGVAWTDTIQGALMLIFIYIGLFLVAGSMGGLGGAASSVLGENPALYDTPGPIGFWTPAMIFSWIILIGMNTAMQPQFFVRFLTANSEQTLRKSLLLFPTVVLLLFFPIAFIGVFGAISYPEIEVADNLFIIMTMDVLPISLAAIVLGGALSALISTADSQILVLSQLLTRDGYRHHVNPESSAKREARVGHILIVALAIVACIVALTEPDFILMFGTISFAGILMLVPAAYATLFWKRTTKEGVIASILVGEAEVFAFLAGVLPAAWYGPFDHSMLGLALAIVTLVVVSLLTEPPSDETIEKFFG